MTLRVVHVVNPTFGKTFSGVTHHTYSMLSGWNDQDIVLDLQGTKIKPLNMNSGEITYRLPPMTLWSSPNIQNSLLDRIRLSFQILFFVVTHQKEYDIFHFHTLTWGSLFSPFILHLMGKKAVFEMSLFGNDNPSYILQQPRGRLQIALMRSFDGAIGISPALVEDAHKHGIRNTVCLPNFLAISQLIGEPNAGMRIQARTRAGIPQEVKILLFVGSMIERKGIDIVIDSFVKLAGQYPNLLLLMVGPLSKKDTTKIDEVYVALQKEIIHRAGLEERVIWMGMVREQALLADCFHASDLFIFPTRNEGFGNVIIEAMAAGLPVVATNLTGITDQIVAEAESGFLVEMDQTDQFVLAVDQLLRDDSKRLTMGAAGHKIALEKFGFDNYCRRLKEFYLEIFALKE